MKRLLYSWIAVVFCACSDDPVSTVTDTVSTDSLRIDSVAQVPAALPVEARLCGPMIDLANYIDSNGFTSDPARLSTVYTGLSNNEKLTARQHLFFLCPIEETGIGVGETAPREEQEMVMWFDSLYAGSNEPVIVYFFTEEHSTTSVINDGIVEQWKFADTATTRAAADKLIFTENIFGHNSPPMVCCVDSCMYVFRSRSTPAMYAILPIFKEFVRRNDAVVVARENGWK